jgi:hypothetical protein
VARRLGRIRRIVTRTRGQPRHRLGNRLIPLTFEEITRMTTKTFPLSGPISLSCRIGFGAIKVHAADDVHEATVELTVRDQESDFASRTTVEMRGSTLVVHAPKPRGTLFDIPLFAGRFAEQDALDVEVTVPSGTQLKIASYGAAVAVQGRCGDADIASGSTSTDIDHVDGDLRLRYGSGPARVGRVRGSVVVKSGSGIATFGEVGGSLDMSCGSGGLELGTAHGSVRLRTGAGQASIGVAEGNVELASGSGGLSVGLRAGQAARVDVVTGGGQLRSELPVEDTPPAATGRALTIRARTGSGDVRIFRAEAPAPA